VYEKNNILYWDSDNNYSSIDDVLSGTMFFGSGFGILASGIRNNRDRYYGFFTVYTYETKEKIKIKIIGNRETIYKRVRKYF